MTKIYRRLLWFMAMLHGVLTVAILLFPGEAIELGVKDSILMFLIIGTFLYSSMWITMDASIKLQVARSESMQRIYLRGERMGLIGIFASLGMFIIFVLSI